MHYSQSGFTMLHNNTIANFATLFRGFQYASTKPREEIVKKSTAKSTLEELFTEGDQILEFHLDKLMLQFKSRNSQFYRDYINARIIEDRGTRTTPTVTPVPVTSAIY